jgi:hypothetical protein
MGDLAIRPSLALRSWLQAELDAFAKDGRADDWIRRAGHRAGAVLIDGHATGALIWFLDLDGVLSELDTDDVQQRLEPITDPEVYARVIRAAAVHHPELLELVDGR